MRLKLDKFRRVHEVIGAWRSVETKAVCRVRFQIASIFLILCTTLSAAEKTFTPDQIEFFQKSIQPVLAENCFRCHGGAEPNAEGKVKIKSGLQLISRLGITKGGEHGTAFNEASPADSLLLRVISYDDDHLKMPPSGKLGADERQAIKQWVEMGMPWTIGEENKLVAVAEESHGAGKGPDNTWTYEPMKRPVPPAMAEAKGNPIDAFLLQKLKEKNLTFSPPAEKESLIRRAYYDLTGLPPSPEKVGEFVRDQDPEAYTRLVNQLLASPQYGEKYARHWLDLMRYAETNGFERDAFKDQIWRYRQWVIDSMNSDLPYDEFIKEQLAGDEIPNVSSGSLIATGYWNLMQWDDEPADPLQHAYDVLDDHVRVTGETFLGVTIGCARCHNHKTDPISQKDYYAFMSFMHGLSPYSLKGRLRDVTDPGKPLGRPNPNASPLAGTPQAREAEQKLELQLVAFQKEARKRFAEKAHVEPPVEAGKILFADSRKTPNTWFYTLEQPNDRWPNPGFVPSPAKGWKEAPGGFGNKGTPGAVVGTEWRTQDIWLRGAFQLSAIPSALNLIIHHDEDAEIFLNGKLVKQLRGFLGEYVTVPLGPDAVTALQTGKNILAIHVSQTSGGQFVDAGLEVGDPAIAQLIEQRGSEICQTSELDGYHKIQKQLEGLRLAREEASANRMFAQIAIEGGKKPADIFVQVRGNAHVTGDKVEPAFPAVFKGGEPNIIPTERTSGRRRALAEWLTNPENPRTARIMVNRVWQWHFGRGLNPSSSDFGKMGVGVTHPELLDWLATHFVQEKWSLKQLHRLIMSSQAYQQKASFGDDSKAGHSADPANNLWWRFDMRRLSSEEIRDSILSVSGSLDLTMGGESFYAELPAEVIATASGGKNAWGVSPPEQRNRRSIYMKSKRSLANPLMTDFDQADTDNSCPVRFTTTVPTQALNFLNSKFLDEQADALAKRLQSMSPNDVKSQIVTGLALLTQRPAKEAEVAQLMELYQTFQTKHGNDAKTAFERVCLVLLNLNEFIYVD